jgi:hypothetical protein
MIRLQEVIKECNYSYYIVVARDFNARVRKKPILNVEGKWKTIINYNGNLLKGFISYDNLRILLQTQRST